MTQQARQPRLRTRALEKMHRTLGIMLAGAGFDLCAFLAILRRYRFSITPGRLPLALWMAITSLTISVLKLLETAACGSRVRAARVHESPLFVLGHWRSGTTLLHELLSQDQRFTFPSSYACFSPHHFLLTERVVTPVVKRMILSKRLQDEMDIGPETAQEDEFALAMMGAVSPYASHLFPRLEQSCLNIYEFENLPEADRKDWEEHFMHFLKKLTVRRNKPLLLKSPTHTFRIPTLLRLFPKARFVHIVRDPYSVVPSTIHTWEACAQLVSLQPPDSSEFEDFVLHLFRAMHRTFLRDRNLIPPGQLYCLRYEDLTRDICGEMEKLYAALDLGGFENVRPGLRAYAERTVGYKKNIFAIPESLHSRIRSSWEPFAARYGYGSQPSYIHRKARTS